MIKTIYAQSKKPGVSRTEFVALWREHGARAMMHEDYFGSVYRYIQSDVLNAATAKVNGTAGYDGVGELFFPDEDSRNKSNASDSRRDVIVPHGNALFGSANPISLVCDERVIHNDHRAPIKAYLFFKLLPDLAPDQFFGEHNDGSLKSLIAGARRAGPASYVRSRSLQPSSYAGVEEVGFDHVEDAVSFIAGHLAGPNGYWSRFSEPSQNVLLLTEQVVMYERANYA